MGEKFMVIRITGAAFVAIAALLAGCGADDAPVPAPSPSAAADTNADEEQIGDLMNQATDATNTWDGTRMGELTCARYRAEASSFSDVVPPMDIFSSAKEAAVSLGPDKFAELIGEQFTGASPESLRAVADAVIRDDPAAYHPAMFDVMKQVSKFRLDKVDNVVVNGDNATADATITFTIGAQPPETQQAEVELVREDGQWKDCTPPGQ
jgi:hypothetical protein